MLKDIFEGHLKNKKERGLVEKVLNSSIADGYVDIKVYKNTEDGKKLVYHDTGDNVVTDWMRHNIVLLLTGHLNSKVGKYYNSDGQIPGHNITTYCKEHSNNNEKNLDGYILNDEQYLWDINNMSKQEISTENSYPYFPTKVLFGTKKEFTSWEELENDTSLSDSEKSILKNQYSDSENDGSYTNNFNSLLDLESNWYSATVGTQGVYTDTTGLTQLLKTITINDESSSSSTNNSSEMYKYYGVVGAVKTLYLPGNGKVENELKNEEIVENINSILEDSTDEYGNRLLKGKFRGAGYPCFIYFNRDNTSSEENEDWMNTEAAHIFLSKDENVEYLNRITFKITMPSQTASNAAMGEYYPYNNYTLRQIGLFNDSYISVDNKTPSLSEQMPGGTLLAVKDIAAFTKTADETVVLTWTLTV